MAAKKRKPKSRSGPNIPESQRSGCKVQYRLPEREAQALAYAAQAAHLPVGVYARRAMIAHLDLPREPTEAEDQAACDADERYELAREHDDYLEESGYYDRD